MSQPQRNSCVCACACGLWCEVVICELHGFRTSSQFLDNRRGAFVNLLQKNDGHLRRDRDVEGRCGGEGGSDGEGGAVWRRRSGDALGDDGGGACVADRLLPQPYRTGQPIALVVAGLPPGCVASMPTAVASSGQDALGRVLGWCSTLGTAVTRTQGRRSDVVRLPLP